MPKKFEIRISGEASVSDQSETNLKFEFLKLYVWKIGILSIRASNLEPSIVMQTISSKDPAVEIEGQVELLSFPGSTLPTFRPLLYFAPEGLPPAPAGTTSFQR